MVKCTGGTRSPEGMKSKLEMLPNKNINQSLLPNHTVRQRDKFSLLFELKIVGHPGFQERPE